MSKSIYSKVIKAISKNDDDKMQYQNIEKAIKSEAKSKDDKILLYAETSSLSLSEEPALLLGFLSLGVAIISIFIRNSINNVLVIFSLILWLIAFIYMICSHRNNYYKEYIKAILKNKYNIK